MENIILIGMPGVGKSTVGVVLAKVLCMDFIDTDLLIQRAEGKRLSESIASLGAEGFLGLENRICASVDEKNAVIATGGSAVFGKEGMENLKRQGTVVYLRASADEIEKRLGDLRARGVVLRDGQTFADLVDERTPLYEKYADIVVDEDGRTLEQTLGAILEKIKIRQ